MLVLTPAASYSSTRLNFVGTGPEKNTLETPTDENHIVTLLTRPCEDFMSYDIHQF